MKLCHLISGLILVTAIAIPLTAQTGPAVLKKGELVTSSLKKGEKQEYSLSLNPNQFALVKVLQKGIDVTIAVFDPAGSRIKDVDSPNGKEGPEYVTFFTEGKGFYRLEVRPTDQDPAEGQYDIQVIKIEPKGATPEKQVDQLFAVWNDPEAPGAAVAAVKDGRIVFKKGYGSADLEFNIPISPATVFHMASVSKQFTAFAVLLLEKEGKLSLDDDVRKYIPEVPDFGKVITLRELAHHTSGLRDQWDLLCMAGWRMDDVITREHILKLVSRQKELNFDPGEKFLYCNTGFTLLAEVVARVSGKSFAEFTKERIFQPLHMDHTLFYDDHEKIVKNRAYSYSPAEKGFKKSVLNYANVGATSLFTTVEDLSLWAVNFENPVVGDEKIIAEMNTRGILNNGDTISYGLGQDIGKYKGLNFINHGGADAGYRTFLARFPDQKFSVMVLSNSAVFSPGDLALKVADIYLAGSIEKPKPEAEAKPAPSTENQVFEQDTTLMRAACGQYELQPGMIVTISMAGNLLYVEAPGLDKTAMNQVSVSEFTVKAAGAKVTFPREPDGLVHKMIANMGGREMIAPRVMDFKPEAVDLSEYTGEYFSPELLTTYYLSVEQGKLIVKHQRLSDFALKPSKKDSFAGDLWTFGQVDFVRNSDKKISGFKASTGRVLNLWFAKVRM